MFNDRQKALEALEAELLREEEQEELLPEEELLEEEPLYRNFSNDYGNINAYNRDIEEADLEDYVQEVREPKGTNKTKGLLALLLILVAGIFLMLALMLARYR